ncbi:CHASE2 domain-containing protein [Heliobacterium chlorum]|nr:adenylate/guanylate cyclase domain-containing protein [Heliobacterium chlorum]
MKAQQHLVALSLILFMAVTMFLGWWTPLESMTYDMWFRIRGSQVPSNDIVIIGIDDESLAKIGRWPWNRTVHAKLLDALSEARAVGFDFTLPASSDPTEDNSFAEAISTHGKVVLAANYTFEKEGNDTFQVLRFPASPLLKAAKGLGFVNFPTESDNIVRRVLPATYERERPFPSFSLAVGMTAQGIPMQQLKISNGHIQAGTMDIPWVNQRSPLINFWGPAETIPTYPYYKVINGIIPKDTFKDKIVFVGPTSPLLSDKFQTPFTRSNMVLQSSHPSSGVELHATALECYLSGRYYAQAPLWLNLLAVILVGTTTYIISINQKRWTGLLSLSGVTLLWIFLTGLLHVHAHLWINLVTPLATGFLTYLAASVFNFITEELERKKVQHLFGRYVSPTVVDQLLSRPEMVHLGGQRVDTTILFSDIRGFTSYSEGRTPEEVVGRLNEYFSRMTQVIFKHGGTLDKFMGDGIMAVFGAPIADPDHALHALEAAKEMCSTLEEMNQGWRERGEPLFNLGVGLNSGPVLAGNIGSEERMEYTVIGEDVNLSSRLESLNKQYKSRIILSERTLQYLTESATRTGQLPVRVDKGDMINVQQTSTQQELLQYFQLEEMGEVSVRGMVQPVKIYTLPAYNDN